MRLGLSLGILVLGLVGCAVPNSLNIPSNGTFTSQRLGVQAVTTIAVTEAYQWLQDPNATFVVLDLRTPQEYAGGHLAKSTLMNFYDPGFKTALLDMNRHQPYIIYCQSGNRSGQALEQMRELGFKNVYNLKGGILAWSGQQYPLEK